MFTLLFQTPVTYDIIKMRGAVSEERQYIAVLHYGEETYRGEGSSEMYAKYRAAHMAIKALDRTGNTYMQSLANRCPFSHVLHVIQHCSRSRFFPMRHYLSRIPHFNFPIFVTCS